MPKLNDEDAQRVAEAESEGSCMADGLYEMELLAVTDTGKDGAPLSGPKGPYWSWEFIVPDDAERYKGWHQWMKTSLSKDAGWKMNEAFAAFGVTPDTDTDELIGKRCLVQVYTYVQTMGQRAGQTVSGVEKLLPLESATNAPSGGAKVSEDPF